MSQSGFLVSLFLILFCRLYPCASCFTIHFLSLSFSHPFSVFTCVLVKITSLHLHPLRFFYVGSLDLFLLLVLGCSGLQILSAECKKSCFCCVSTLTNATASWFNSFLQWQLKVWCKNVLLFPLILNYITKVISLWSCNLDIYSVFMGFFGKTCTFLNIFLEMFHFSL